MTIFKNILERMAAGQMNGLYSKPVLSLEQGEIRFYEGADPDGTFIIDSCNRVPVCGTVHSLHPAVTVLETAFQGKSEIHYSVDAMMLKEYGNLTADGLLICCNGEEKVIPLHIISLTEESLKNISDGVVSDHENKLLEKSDYLKEKELISKLTRNYLAFLCAVKKDADQTEITQLCRQLSAIVEALCLLRPECIRYRLFEAILAAKKQNLSYAESLERRMRNIIISARKNHPTEYCLLRYLQYEIARQSRNYTEAGNKKKQLLEYLEYALDQVPLETELICLYGEESLNVMESDPVDFWERLHGLYDSGNNSPFLYLFGMSVLSSNALENQQDLFTDSFVFRCLNTGARYGMITRTGAERILQSITSFKAPYLLSLYKNIYNSYPDNDILLSICRLMIQMDMRNEKAFPYYKKAVKEKLKPARLYDYYMYSLPDGFDEPVERELLLYYSADSYVNPEIYIKLCVNLLQFYSSDAQLMELYMPHMQNFIRTRIAHKRISYDLAYLVDEVITPEMLDEELRDGILPMLFMAEISADLEDGSYAVYDSGIHTELIRGYMKNGKTMLFMYGGCGSLHLFDAKDRKIEGISLKITPLIQNEELMEAVCSWDNQTASLNLLRHGKWLLQYYGKSEDGVFNSFYEASEPTDLSTNVGYLSEPRISNKLKRYILQYIMEKNHLEDSDPFDGKAEYADVLYAHMDLLESNQAANGFHYLVKHDHITEAMKLWNRLSGKGFLTEDVFYLAQKLLKSYEKKDQPVLEQILLFLMNEDSLDEEMLVYLTGDVYRTMETQVRILMTCRNQNMNHQELSAQILLRQLMQNTPDWSVLQLTYEELVNHDRYALLNYAAMNAICYGYLLKNIKLEINLAAFVQGEILFSGKTDNLTDWTCLAFIKQMENSDNETESVLGIRRQICESVQKKGYILEFVQREAAKTGIPCYPVFTVNLSENGIFGENMLEMINTYPEKLQGEYRISGTEKIYSCRLFPVLEGLYSAKIVAFAGEHIEYRLRFAEKMTDWVSFKPWNYAIRNPEGLAERYYMLQNLSSDFEEGTVDAEKMQNYEVIMSIIHAYGKVL